MALTSGPPYDYPGESERSNEKTVDRIDRGSSACLRWASRAVRQFEGKSIGKHRAAGQLLIEELGRHRSLSECRRRERRDADRVSQYGRCDLLSPGVPEGDRNSEWDISHRDCLSEHLSGRPEPRHIASTRHIESGHPSVGSGRGRRRTPHGDVTVCAQALQIRHCLVAGRAGLKNTLGQTSQGSN